MTGPWITITGPHPTSEMASDAAVISHEQDFKQFALFLGRKFHSYVMGRTADLTALERRGLVEIHKENVEVTEKGKAYLKPNSAK